MCLTVQIVLDEEVASLLEVDAAVVTHETLGVVELVPGLDDGAAGGRRRSKGRRFEKQNQESETSKFEFRFAPYFSFGPVP